MDSWLKKLNDNSNKPTVDDVEAANEANITLTCTLKKCKFKNHAINTHIFANLCGDTKLEFKTLLQHCEVRWLSKVKAFKRLLMLKNKVVIFLTEKNSCFAVESSHSSH